MPDEGDRRSEARTRAREVGERAQELTARLARLQAGEHSTAEDLQSAEKAAQESLAHGVVARERAAAAHRSAARAHRSAAEVADEAGDHVRAEQHLSSARDDDEAAIQDDAGADAASGRLERRICG